MMVSDANNSTVGVQLKHQLSYGGGATCTVLTDGQMRKPLMEGEHVPRYVKRRYLGSFQRVMRDEVVIARNALSKK